MLKNDAPWTFLPNIPCFLFLGPLGVEVDFLCPIAEVSFLKPLKENQLSEPIPYRKKVRIILVWCPQTAYVQRGAPDSH